MSSNQTEKFNLEKNQINAKNESLENNVALTGSTSSNEMIPEVESQEIDEFFDAQDFVSKSSPSNLQEDSDSESVESFYTATESEYVEEISMTQKTIVSEHKLIVEGEVFTEKKKNEAWSKPGSFSVQIGIFIMLYAFMAQFVLKSIINLYI